MAEATDSRQGRLRRRVRAGWRVARWPALAVLGLAALILGQVGFHQHLAAQGEPAPFTRSLYLSIQLFVLESGAVDPPVPWALEFARLAAPATTLVSAVSALLAVFRDEWGRVRLRFYRGHIVVCGLGDKGSLLVRSCRRLGRRVVAIEVDPASPGIAPARSEGAVVVLGDATRPDTWERLRLGRAASVVVLCGEDAIDIEVAGVVQALAPRRTSLLGVLAHVEEAGLRNILQVGAVAAGGDVLVEYFDVHERGAGVVLTRVRPMTPVTDRGPHVVVLGLGRLGIALTMRLARWWRDTGDDGRRIRLTLVDRDAEAATAGLLEREVGLPAIADMRAFDLSVDSPGFLHLAFLEEGSPPVDAVYVCLEGERTSLAAAGVLRDGLGVGVPIVAQVSHPVALEPPMSGFPLLKETCTPEVLLGGVWERLARAIHDDYVRREEGLGHTEDENPSVAPWERLSEDLRASNRAQAADIGSKLGVIRCGIAPSRGLADPLLVFEPDEIERLARLEHERWMDRLIGAGWVQAPGEKDPETKTHPDLVPYDELSEEKREADRSAVRGIPAFLEIVGLHAHRFEVPAGHRAVPAAEPTSGDPSRLRNAQ